MNHNSRCRMIAVSKCTIVVATQTPERVARKFSPAKITASLRACEAFSPPAKLAAHPAGMRWYCSSPAKRGFVKPGWYYHPGKILQNHIAEFVGN